MANGFKSFPTSKLPRTKKSVGNYSFKKGLLGFPKPSVWDNPLNTNSDGQQGWVIIGDSTAAGTTPQDNETSAPITYSGILTNYNADTATIDAITGDVYNAAFGSPWVTFGMNYYYRTGYKICFSPRGAPGSEFCSVGDTNNWDVSGVLYSDMRSAATNMLTRLNIPMLRGIIIQGGINDTRGTVEISEITSAISRLVNRLQADFFKVPIYFVNIGKSEFGVTQRVLDVRSYIETLPNIFHNVFIINRLGDAPFNDEMYDDDDLHHSQFMNELNGAMCIKNMASDGLIAQSPPDIVYPSATTGALDRLVGLPGIYNAHVNNFVTYLDTNSHWANIDSFYAPLLNEDSLSRQDWIRATKKFTPTGGYTWSKQTGYIYDGVSGYGDMNFVPTVDGVNFSLNDCNLSAFMLQRLSAAGDLIGSIGSNTNHRAMIFEVPGSNNVQCFMHSGTTMTRSTYAMKGYYYYAGRRLSSSSTQFIENATQLTTGTSTSVAMSPQTVVFAARNNNGSILAFKNCGMGPVMFSKSSVGITVVYRKIRELTANLIAENN